MAGVEGLTILGSISSVISIIEGTKQIYNTATNSQGLPKAFEEVAIRLPIVETMLASAQRGIADAASKGVYYDGAEDTMKNCKGKAERLQELFQVVIPQTMLPDKKGTSQLSGLSVEEVESGP
ncbi:hypothetical protein MMC25_002066 [Agyrium rufum]|nr:hypothetical protein [Agyrium rufum]